MTSVSSRRKILQGLGLLSVTGLAGCSALSPRQRLLISVINNTETRHILELSVVDGDETLVRQYIELPAETANASPEIETVVLLGRISNGKRVNVNAVLDEEEASETDAPLILDCGSEYSGNAVTVRVEKGGSVHLSDDLAANHCFSGTETGAGDSDWLVNETES